MNCIKCQSENTQRAELIYESGTSDIKTHSTSVGFGGSGGGLGIGTASTSTRGTSQSKLAKKLAPPRRFPSAFAAVAGVALILCGLGVSNGNFGLLTVLSLAAAALCFAYAIRWEVVVKPKLYAGWLATWHCNRCGTIYSEPGAYDPYKATTATTKLWTGVTGLSAIVCFILLAAQSGTANSVSANNTPRLPTDADFNPGSNEPGSAIQTKPQPHHKVAAKKIKYTVKSTVPMTITAPGGRVICTVPVGTELPVAGSRNIKANTQGPVMVSSYVADLCPGESEPRDMEHIRIFRGTVVSAEPST